MKKLNWLLFLTFILIFVLLFVPIVTTKVEMKGYYHCEKLGDTIYVTGDGIVVTNNKYVIKSAIVKGKILDENNQVIHVINYPISEGNNDIDFFKILKSDYTPSKMIIEITDVYYDYLGDLMISIVSLIFAIYLFPPFHKLESMISQESKNDSQDSMDQEN